MTKQEHVSALRADTTVHYNCCQSVLIPFARECGLSPEAANALGSNFGAGMRRGATCGAVTGALMVLGMTGRDAAAAKALTDAFKEKNGCLDCAQLLSAAAQRGEERKPHCDRMVHEAVSLLEELEK